MSSNLDFDDFEILDIKGNKIKLEPDPPKPVQVPPSSKPTILPPSRKAPAKPAPRPPSKVHAQPPPFEQEPNNTQHPPSHQQAPQHTSPAAPTTPTPPPAQSHDEHGNPRIPLLAPITIRDKIINEIYQTELSYVEGLQICLQYYYNNLKGRIPDDKLNTLFLHFPQVLETNKAVLQTMQTYLEEGTFDKSVGQTFLSMMPFFKAYSFYCGNSLQSSQVIVELSKNSITQELLDFLRRQIPAKMKLDLRSYLITPVQRLPRYVLLLSELLKNTDETHEDYSNLQTALAQMKDINTKVNASIAEQERRTKLVQIQATLVTTGIEVNIVKGHRVFVKEGMMQKLIKTGFESRYFYLFNDVLLYGVGNEQTLHYSSMMALEQMKVISIPDNVLLKLAFSVNTPNESITLVAQSEEEKKDWVDTLNATIQDHVTKKNSLKVEKKEEERMSMYMADHEVNECPICFAQFSLLVRKRHCENCGACVCGECAKYRIERENKVERICTKCFEKLKSRLDISVVERRTKATPEETKQETKQETKPVVAKQTLNFLNEMKMVQKKRSDHEHGQASKAVVQQEETYYEEEQVGEAYLPQQKQPQQEYHESQQYKHQQQQNEQHDQHDQQQHEQFEQEEYHEEYHEEQAEYYDTEGEHGGYEQEYQPNEYQQHDEQNYYQEEQRNEQEEWEEQARREQQRIAEELQEQERQEQEKWEEEQEQLEREKKAQEEWEQEQARLEQEQLAREREEQERLEQEQWEQEQERVEQERIAQEQWEQEQARMEQERIAQEREEQARLEQEKWEQEQQRMEEERIAQEQWEEEQARLEQERIAQEQWEQEQARLEQERQKEEQRRQQEKQEKERQARNEKERREREERMERERIERERQEEERLEQERIQQEQHEMERNEQERQRQENEMRRQQAVRPRGAAAEGGHGNQPEPNVRPRGGQPPPLSPRSRGAPPQVQAQPPRARGGVQQPVPRAEDTRQQPPTPQRAQQQYGQEQAPSGTPRARGVPPQPQHTQAAVERSRGAPSQEYRQEENRPQGSPRPRGAAMQAPPVSPRRGAAEQAGSGARPVPEAQHEQQAVEPELTQEEIDKQANLTRILQHDPTVRMQPVLPPIGSVKRAAAPNRAPVQQQQNTELEWTLPAEKPEGMSIVQWNRMQQEERIRIQKLKDELSQRRPPRGGRRAMI